MPVETKEVAVTEGGLVKLSVWNYQTNQLEHYYSRYQVVEGVTLKEELRMHREALLSEVTRRADEFMPNLILDTDGQTVVVSSYTD